MGSREAFCLYFRKIHGSLSSRFLHLRFMKSSTDFSHRIMSRSGPQMTPTAFSDMFLFSSAGFLIQKISFSTNDNGQIKRYKDWGLDSIMRAEKRMNMVWRVKEVIAKQDEQVMLLHDLGKKRRKIRLSGNKKFSAFARGFPRLFKVAIDDENMAWIEFTKELDDFILEEEKVKAEYEPIAAENLTKLLMMSVNHRLQIEKLAHLKKDLGLPDDFRTNFLSKYPHFFKVLESTRNGPLLELASWHPSLAISFREQRRHYDENNNTEVKKSLGEAFTYSFKLALPANVVLHNKKRASILRFQERTFPSPYEDITTLKQCSPEVEKRHVALIHEFLHLTLQKRVMADMLSHFRKDFRLPQRFQSFLLRHQDIFYVSHKGDRYTIFLKEAYQGSTVLEKNPLVLMQEQFSELCKKPRKLSSGTLRFQKDEEEAIDRENIDDIHEVDSLNEDFPDDGFST